GEYADKVRSLAAVIDAQQPDVLALQEVGDTEVLGDLQDALTHKLSESSVSDRFEPDHAIRVAFLSRLPINDVRQIRDLVAGLDPVQIFHAQGADALMGSLLRGALQISVDTPLGAVTVVTANLKSKLLCFPEHRQPG